MQNAPPKTFARKQKGAAAIEFALVFMIFFAVFYGLVSYSLPLLMMQSFNAATAEAVRRSVALSPGIDNYATVIKTQAQASLVSQLTWLPPALKFNAADDAKVTYDPATGLLTVSINYPKTKLQNVLPSLVLPGIGPVPNLPTYLSAQSSMQLGN